MARPTREAPSHVPDLRFAGQLVVPEQVGLAVAIEIVDAGDAPRRTHQVSAAIAIGIDRSSADARGSTHVPYLRFAGRSVVPDEVGFTVAVEVLAHRRHRIDGLDDSHVPGGKTGVGLRVRIGRAVLARDDRLRGVEREGLVGDGRGYSITDVKSKSPTVSPGTVSRNWSRRSCPAHCCPPGTLIWPLQMLSHWIVTKSSRLGRLISW